MLISQGTSDRSKQVLIRGSNVCRYLQGPKEVSIDLIRFHFGGSLKKVPKKIEWKNCLFLDLFIFYEFVPYFWLELIYLYSKRLSHIFCPSFNAVFESTYFFKYKNTGIRSFKVETMGKREMLIFSRCQSLTFWL